MPTTTPNYRKYPALAAYIDRIGADEINFKRFMIREWRGEYYLERCLIKIMSDGSIEVSKKEYAPSKEESEEIKREVAKADWPKPIKARDASALHKNADSRYFEFWDRQTNELIMIQERQEPKRFIPWTFYSDGVWRPMEPEEGLPLWKPKTKRTNRVMIHEGAGAAEACEQLIADKNAAHPWRDVLVDYEHWGMIGGALTPHRTRWEELSREKPTEVIYVCDNDHPGNSALKEVARNYKGSLKGIMFSGKFPISWDMADPIPPELFAGERYIGPSLQSFMKPATWATEQIASKPPTYTIRSHFREEWLHTVKPDCYIHKTWPSQVHTANEFNNFVAPFSDVTDTARLLRKDAAGKGLTLQYNPSIASGMYTLSRDKSYFVNTHVPSEIKAEKGDVQPWLDFMNHLIPNEGDRLELLRWCATLIAKPDVKIRYGVLLISENQGVGKSTLGEKILAPLIGYENVSYPSEQSITESNFNYWAAHKRLAVVHEIYAGHSAKAYNRLKSIISEDAIEVNKKYMADYTIENWLHILACSNSMRAIKLSDDDRRWFVPQVTEVRKPKFWDGESNKYWTYLNDWLVYEGGLQFIKHWAEQWVKKHGHVLVGDVAPWSSVKAKVVEEGYSPGQLIIAELLESIRRDYPDRHILFSDKALVGFIQQQLYDGKFSDRLEKPSTVRRLAKSKNWFVHPERVWVQGELRGSYLICSHFEDTSLSVDQIKDLVTQSNELVKSYGFEVNGQRKQ